MITLQPTGSNRTSKVNCSNMGNKAGHTLVVILGRRPELVSAEAAVVDAVFRNSCDAKPSALWNDPMRSNVRCCTHSR